MESEREVTMRGFTIVELLIVIVVIAILAAITVVAYNGIQERSRNTQTIQAATEYAKALQAYKAINGAYPAPGGWTCIAGASTKCGNMTDTTSACFTVAQYSGSSPLDTQIKTVIQNLPQPSTQQIPCATGHLYGGVMYGWSWVLWYLSGTQSCTNLGGLVNITTNYSGNVTQCYGTLP